MDRVKVTLVALLPALWLMASGQSFLNPCAHCASATSRDSASAFESRHSCPSGAAGSVDLSARRANPRIGAQSAKSNFPPFEPINGSQAFDRTFPANSSSQREGLIALAVRWQFDFRAASEPRAPSLVS
jgi:hypothetical protein